MKRNLLKLTLALSLFLSLLAVTSQHVVHWNPVPWCL